MTIIGTDTFIAPRFFKEGVGIELRQDGVSQALEIGLKGTAASDTELILFIGASNAWGNEYADTGDKTATPGWKVWNYDTSAFVSPVLGSNPFRPATSPYTAPNNWGFQYCNLRVAAGKDALLVHLAKPSTNFLQWTDRDFGGVNSSANNFDSGTSAGTIPKVQDVMTSVMASAQVRAAGLSTVTKVLVDLGGIDTLIGQDAIIDRIENFIASLRAQSWCGATTPIIAVEMPPRGSYGDVTTALNRYFTSAADPYFGLISLEGVPFTIDDYPSAGDVAHYAGRGMVTVASRAQDMYNKLPVAHLGTGKNVGAGLGVILSTAASDGTVPGESRSVPYVASCSDDGTVYTLSTPAATRPISYIELSAVNAPRNVRTTFHNYRSDGAVLCLMAPRKPAINITNISVGAGPNYFVTVTYDGTIDDSDPDYFARVYISGVGGATQANDRYFEIISLNTTAKTFVLQNAEGVYTNGQTWSAYTSGGTIEQLIAFEDPRTRNKFASEVYLFENETVTYERLGGGATAPFRVVEFTPHPNYLPAQDIYRADNPVLNGDFRMLMTGWSTSTRSDSTWQISRAASSQSITGITRANPAVVTYSGSDIYENGDLVTIKDVSGMTEVNDRTFVIANVNTAANTFQLSGVNSSAYTTYTSGGTIHHGGGRFAGSRSMVLKDTSGLANNLFWSYRLRVQPGDEIFARCRIEAVGVSSLLTTCRLFFQYFDVDGVQVGSDVAGPEDLTVRSDWTVLDHYDTVPDDAVEATVYLRVATTLGTVAVTDFEFGPTPDVVKSSDYGCSPSLTDNAYRLNQLLTASIGMGREALIDLSGVYTINSFLSIASNLRLRGLGRDLVTIKLSDTYFGSILSAGTTYFENVTISDLTLDGNSQRLAIGSAGHAIAGYHFDNFRLERLKIQNSLGYAVGLQGYPYAAVGKQGPQEDFTMIDVEMYFCGHGKFRQSTIVGALTAGDTSITVSDVTQFDASGGTMQIGDEVIRYGAPTGSTFSVVRGICGTTAASHANGATVYRLANGDGIDTKSGRRYYLENVIAQYCGDQGINVRCRNATIVAPRLIGNVLGMGLNAIGTAVNTASTLSGSITATATSITLTDASAFPTTGTGRVDAEEVTWTGKSTNTLTGVTRGVGGTVPVPHNSGVTFALDAGDDAEDSFIQVFGGVSQENTLSGVSVASGSGSATCHVEFHGLVCDDNSSGFNFSGAGAGQTRVTLIGCLARNNTQYGIYAEYMENVHIVGTQIYGNGSDGIRLFSCPNGGSVVSCDIRNNGAWGVVETGSTDRFEYEANRIYANTTGNLRKIGVAARRTSLRVSDFLNWNVSPADNTAAIKAAITAATVEGVLTIEFPPGDFVLTAPASSQVAADEGEAILLSPSHSDLTFVGNGTRLIPASNKIEMFVINGADNITFKNIIFDNSDNGPLQNQVKPSSLAGRNTGVAGLGNAANAAIRQYEGSGLKVIDCEFIDWLVAINYIGSFDDDQVLVGDYVSERCKFVGCCQGHLLEQPRTIRIAHQHNEDNIDSTNADASVDPGHLLYVTNRTGAAPDQISVHDIHDRNGNSSALKIRKGTVVTVSDVNVYESGRGIEITSAEFGTLTNFSVKLKEVADDTSQSGLGLEDCGAFTASNGVIDISGATAWGVRVEEETSGEAFNNKNNRITNVRVINDFSAETGKDAFIIQDQTNIEIEDCGLIHNGTVVDTRSVISLTDCVSPRIKRPFRRTPDAPASSRDKLVRVLSGTTDAFIEYARQDIDVAPSADTVTDAGTDTVVLRVDGMQTGTWTPAATFATPGDWAPTSVTAQGYYERRGDILKIDFSLTFTANAYTTASGTFYITGLPFTASDEVDFWSVDISTLANVTLGGTVKWVTGWIDSGDDKISLRGHASASAGSSLTVTAIPASTAGVVLRGTATLRIVEP